MKEPCLCGDPECRNCFPRWAELECPEDHPDWHEQREEWIAERDDYSD
jgi:hypothetical protein